MPTSGDSRPEISRQACCVGTATRSMFRRAAFSTTSAMTGNEPWAPVPMIKRGPAPGDLLVGRERSVAELVAAC